MPKHITPRLAVKPSFLVSKAIRLIMALLMTAALLPLSFLVDAQEAFADTLISVHIPTGTTMTCVDSEGTKYFAEGQFAVEGSGINKAAYCVNYTASFQSGRVLSAADAKTFIPQDLLTKIALANMCAFNGDYSDPNNVQFYEFDSASGEQRYYLVQAYIWLIMGDALGYQLYSTEPTEGPGSWGGSAQFNEALSHLKSFVAATEGSWIGTGTVYYGAGQQIAMDFDIEPASGWIDLQKQSSNTSLSNNNSCYSLDGAVYSICDDASTTHEITRITTNSEGYASSSDIAPGTYYVKETTPAPGYALDTSIYEISVSAGQTTRVNHTEVKDVPQNNPVDMLLEKLDSGTLAGTPQGAASLANAEYTFKFYGVHSATDPATSGHTPLKTWIMKTDQSGKVSLDEAHKVSGDSFYTTSSGKVTLPLGTLTIEETKAPEGYILNNKVVHVTQITSEGVAESVTNYLAPQDKEQVQRGDWRITKEVPSSNDTENQDRTRLLVEGVCFEFYNDNSQAVLAPDGKLKEPGELVCTIVTDENGYASTRDLPYPSEWQGALAYSSYLVKEVIPEDVANRYKNEYGITMLPVSDWKVSISANNQFLPSQLVSNKIPQTPVKIIKKDAATGNPIKGNCGFQILDEQGVAVSYNDPNEAQAIDVWYTGEDGELVLPMKLNEGTYTLVEVEAPDGYALNSQSVQFVVDSFNTWENPIVIEYFDEAIMAQLELQKADSLSGEPVAGAEYSLRATNDIQTNDGSLYFAAGDVVASGILTDEAGYALIDELHLGRYTLYETKAPAGYALDTQEYQVDIVSQGQEIPCVLLRQNLENEPTTVKIIKQDLLSSSPLEGASFKVWKESEGETHEYDFTTLVPAIEQALLELDSSVSHVKLNDEEALREELQDKSAGYSTVFYATGQLVDSASFKPYTLLASLEEDKSISISLDSTNLCSIPALVLADANAFEFEGSTNAEGVLHVPYLEPGSYSVIETEAPFGYLLDLEKEAHTFCVDNQGMIAGQSSIEFEITNYKISMSSHALDATDGDKDVLNSKDARIVDTVSYTNLEAGTEYRLQGTLMSKQTGDFLQVNDKPVTAETIFTAEDPDGTIDVEFEFDAGNATGIDLVVFETLYEEGSDEPIALHEDIDDAMQTVSVVEEPNPASEKPVANTPKTPGSSHDETGNPFGNAPGIVLALLVVIAFMSAGYVLYQRRRSKLERKQLLEKALRW
ncbi:MAG: SpaA isopeptide-forming pilin-related protein [Raoultibacter sp.]|jgi:hypothetical protein